MSATRAQLEERRPEFPLGTHGYDPHLPSMAAVFVARGPSFRSGVVVEPVENVHLYELMARLLGLRPAPNDGDRGRLSHLLRPAPAAGGRAVTHRRGRLGPRVSIDRILCYPFI